MKFVKLTVQNFMSIRTAEVELTDQGLVLVQGKNNDDPAFESNGAGKSTIFESLTYALFDKTIRGLKGDEVINNTVGKNCYVFLDLKDDDGVSYRIARYRKHNEHRNNVYIYRDTKNITPKSSKDSNAFIEQLIRMDYDTFSNSILFGQGLIKMFSTASDADKKSILEKMLNMSIFKDAQEVAKEKLREKKESLTKLETEKANTEGLIAEIEGTVIRLKEQEQEHRLNTSKEIERLREETEKAEKELEEHNENSVDYSSDLEKLNDNKATVEKKLSKFKVYEKARNDIAVELSGLLRDKKRLTSELEGIKKEIEEVKEGKQTNCPTCGQEIKDDTDKEGALKHLAEKARKNITASKDIVAELSEKKGDLEKIDTFLEGKEKIEKEKDAIVGEISELNALIRTKDRIGKGLETRIDELKKSIKRLEGELDKTYKPMIEEKEKQLGKLTERLAEISVERAELSKEVEKINFWVNAYGNSGIKSYLLDSVTPYLNKRANYYLSKLAGNTTEIEFSTQTRLKSGEIRDKFEVRINNLVGGASYDANSTGERRRIDLAISLALQDLVMSRSNGKMNILLYDECFDGLDAVGCENVVQLLQEVSQNTETIFVITHNDHLKPYFDNTLDIIKEGGETRVEKQIRDKGEGNSNIPQS